MAGLGREIGDTGHLRSAAAVLMALFGLALLIPAIGVQDRGDACATLQLRWSSGRGSPSGLLGVFGVGAALAIAWAPCVGPTLGATVALAASGQSLFTSFAAMAMFGLGAATSLLAAGYGLGLLATRSRLRVAKSAALGRVVHGVTFCSLVPRSSPGMTSSSSRPWSRRCRLARKLCNGTLAERTQQIPSRCDASRLFASCQVAGRFGSVLYGVSIGDAREDLDRIKQICTKIRHGYWRDRIPVHKTVHVTCPWTNHCSP